MCIGYRFKKLGYHLLNTAIQPSQLFLLRFIFSIYKMGIIIFQVVVLNKPEPAFVKALGKC